MKRLVVIILAVFWLMAGCAGNGNQPASVNDEVSPTEKPISENTDFRNAYWGMPQQKVWESEGREPDEYTETQDVFLDTPVVGIDAFSGYFYDGKGELRQAGYIFQKKHTNENDYIQDYKKVRDALTEIYGEPKTDAENWKNDLYQDDPDEYGFAVSIGHLVYASSWITKTTNISLVLSGDNYKISMSVFYKDVTYEQEQDTSGL